MFREEGMPVGLLRPITLWPFPDSRVSALAGAARHFLTVEMSMGQMVDDVRLAVNGRRPVYFYGRAGGMLPVARDIYREAKKILTGGVE
jgi:2-oxoglutarate ferredoxin oxidoreductase subunit alpha